MGQQASQVSSLQHGVLMAGIVGVDEGRLKRGVVIVFIFVLLRLSSLLSNLGLGRCLASTWNVVTVQDSESIDTSAVLDHNGISILVNVAVLANPLVVARGFLLESDSVLLGVGRTELAVSHVDPLLLQDSGQAGVAIELGGSLAGAGQGQADAGCEEHLWCEV